MKKVSHILSYPLSAIFYLLFGLTLLLFDPVQRICLRVFGYQAHKKSVDIFNLFIIRSLHVVGTRYRLTVRTRIPEHQPVIFVANHQSMWDIPPIIWFLRKHHPKFISKIELGKRLPTISYNLKYGGSVLIDRKNPKQAMEQIARIGTYIQRHNRSVVIFPEGTRSRDGYPKPFKTKGLQQLFKTAPNAWVVPISISNSWKLQRFGMFPIPLGVSLRFVVHPALQVASYTPMELIMKIEEQIRSEIIH